MLWAVKVNKKLKVSFGSTVKILQAVLEKPGGRSVTLSLRSNGSKAIIAFLDEKNAFASLDLEFDFNEEAVFTVKGEGMVHLTGVEYIDDDSSDEESEVSGDSGVKKTNSVLQEVIKRLYGIKVGNKESEVIGDVITTDASEKIEE